MVEIKVRYSILQSLSVEIERLKTCWIVLTYDTELDLYWLYEEPYKLYMASRDTKLIQV